MPKRVPQSIRLRPVRRSDASTFFRWWHDPRLQHLTSGDHRPLTTQKRDAYFQKLLTSTQAKHWVLEAQNRPIGHVSLRGHGPRPEVQIVIGEPALWGRGLGTAVGRWLTTYARRHQLRGMRMIVWRQNKRSIALGKKFGFRVTGKIQRLTGQRRRTYLTLSATIPPTKHTTE